MAGLSPQDLRAWLRLLGTAADRSVLTALIEGTTHPNEILEAPDDELVRRFHLSARQLDQLHRLPPRGEIERQAGVMEELGIGLVPMTAPEYPANLFRMRTSPPAIFVKGRLESFDSLAVGIVGPRTPTPYGIDVARHLAREFAPTLTVVSGAALGIDSAAHEAVLDAGGRTIAVLGCGIDVDYPAGNRALRQRIGAGDAGALVSTFPPGTQPLRQNFPNRNIILAGLCHGVVIVEAGEKSGALVTARAAGEEGRGVYAVPGDITRRNSKGSNALLRDGAIACTCAQDVIADLESTLRDELEELRRRRTASSADSPAESADDAPTQAETLLLNDILHHPVSFDDLMARYVPDPLTIGDLTTALLMLEMKGKVRQEPGRVYAGKM